MERNAWMMVVIFWEQKFFLPERLNEIGVEEEAWEIWRLRKLEDWENSGNSERFREIWKRKGFNEEEESLFIVIQQNSTAEIELGLLILWLGFNPGAWRQSQNRVWWFI